MQAERQRHKEQMEALMKTLAEHQNVHTVINASTSTPKFTPFDNSTELWEDYWERFCTFIAANSIPKGRKTSSVADKSGQLLSISC